MTTKRETCAIAFDGGGADRCQNDPWICAEHMSERDRRHMVERSAYGASEYERGYRAGIEAAAKEAERHGYMCRLVVIDAIRALAAAPKEER